ncbi:MAG: hypothetical protein B7X89_10245 [Sulfuricurvum sp. 17-40-25]|nr:MAG: hypothetical protein B7Y30_06780 [Campylobacterales bacterium 16-40-21]OYZ66395.1 MAG: hypothetical protein B7Y17_01685 [Sulfuricurvum sp. 24-42-5]OZA02204.1 MAG: hypothetical protein B7X89_10245 [Sulfuricurvum sp. 17-40-25]
MKFCEAFYLSSDLRYRVQFEFKFDVSNFHEREGFEQLTKAFTAHVKSFGTGNFFPEEIVNQLDDAGLDRLLQDTELIPNMTFFLKLNSVETFYSRETCELYRLRGANCVMSMVETLDGKVIDILEMKNVMRVFERVG